MKNQSKSSSISFAGTSPNVHSDRPSNRILSVFTIFSFISITVILSLSGFGIYRIYAGHIIRGAENNAISIGNTIFQQEKSLLLEHSPKGDSLNVRAEVFPILDERMHNYFKFLSIFKIKFFNVFKTIVYSTDHSIIGKADSYNSALERALKGEIVSKILKKGSILDLAGETKYNVDVVETYFPIKDEKHHVIGSFEIYIDVTRSYAELRQVLISSVLILLVVLLLVFMVLYLLMKNLTKKLSATQNELRTMAITDGLTGIFNRRHLMSRAEEELEKVLRRKDQGLGMIMIDIDHFKLINDQYGHLCGDEILKGVADRIQKSIRKYDMVGRYGGEEFLVVLPDSSFDDIRVVGERIWKFIREKPFIVNGSSHHITVTLGLACSVDGEKETQWALKRADEALYKGKNSGRDCLAWV